MSCDCPEIVFSVLSNFVRRELAKVSQALRYLNLLDEAAASVNSDTVSAVQQAEDTIPDPPVLGFTDALTALACPLLPAALSVQEYQKRRQAKSGDGLLSEMQKQTPEEQFSRVKQMYAAYAADLSTGYDRTLQALSQFSVVQLARQYANNLRNTDATADSHAVALSVTQQVLALCPERYTGSVFQQYDEATIDFNPGNVTPDPTSPIGQVMSSITRADAKLGAWRALSVS